MAIARVGLVALATTTASGWTCALPAGVQDGDLLLAVIVKGADTAPTTPAGKTYTLLDARDTTAVSNPFVWCYGHVLAAADAGTNHTWAWVNIRCAAAALILRGAAAALDVPDPPAAGQGNSTTVVAPASTVTTPGAWVVWASATVASPTHSWAATADGNAVTREVGASTGAMGLAWATYPAAGAVAAATVTFSVTGRAMGKTLVVKPTAAPTGAAAQRWTGSAWTPAAAQRWTGSAWTPATVKRWDGTGWV